MGTMWKTASGKKVNVERSSWTPRSVPLGELQQQRPVTSTSEEEQPFKPKQQKCPLCEQSFTFYCLISHLREAHNNASTHILVQKKVEKTVPCTVEGCTYKGMNEEALKRHMRRTHQGVAVTIRSWQCPLCESVVDGQAALNEHCRIQHEKQGCGVKSLTFSTKAEYEAWKTEYEKHNIIKWRNNGTVTSDDHIMIHYVCNRSGVARSEAKGVRQVKKSRIVTRYCTSFLKAKIYNEGGVSIRYCGEHVGHPIAASMLPLTDADKQSIGNYLHLGLTVPVVLGIIRKQYVNPNHRLFWTSASDIRNTQKGLSMQPGRLHEDDLKSLEMRYQLAVTEDGIRKFELPSSNDGAGFRLVVITPDQVELIKRYSSRGISIDDTHCTTRYNLKLATMMVVDDYGRGVPAGFLLANKMDKDECSAFFETVKNAYSDFEPRFFLSDDTMTFWNGYREVYRNNNTTKLLCSWHCQKAISEKLNSYIGGKDNDKKREIEGWIKVLFTQSNKIEFYKAKSMLLTLLSQYRTQHQGLASFDDYFRRYYLTRQEQWAPYNRIAAIANTTMVSERWHRTLKYTLLNRSANRRADELVHVLISAVPAIAREHLIQDERGTSEGKFRAKENILRHKRAVEQVENITITHKRDTEWTIASFNAPGKLYVLTVVQCQCENRKMHCTLCGVCPVCITCSCADAVKSGISCKHAHAFALNHDANTTSDDSSQSTLYECDSLQSDMICDSQESTPTAAGEQIETETVDNTVGLSDKRREIITELQEYMDRLSFSWNTRTAVDEERLQSLIRTRDMMAKVVEEELGGSQGANLVPRRTLPRRGRAVVTKQGRAVVTKQSSVKRMAKRRLPTQAESPTAFHTGNINTDELNICVLCEDTQPPLDDPADEPIMEGAVVDWWCCTTCKTWAHRDCMRHRDCPVCEGVFEPTG